MAGHGGCTLPTGHLASSRSSARHQHTTRVVRPVPLALAAFLGVVGAAMLTVGLMGALRKPQPRPRRAQDAWASIVDRCARRSPGRRPPWHSSRCSWACRPALFFGGQSLEHPRRSARGPSAAPPAACPPRGRHVATLALATPLPPSPGTRARRLRPAEVLRTRVTREGGRRPERTRVAPVRGGHRSGLGPRRGPPRPPTRASDGPGARRPPLRDATALAVLTVAIAVLLAGWLGAAGGACPVRGTHVVLASAVHPSSSCESGGRSHRRHRMSAVIGGLVLVAAGSHGSGAAPQLR